MSIQGVSINDDGHSQVRMGVEAAVPRLCDLARVLHRRRAPARR